MIVYFELFKVLLLLGLSIALSPFLKAESQVLSIDHTFAVNQSFQLFNTFVNFYIVSARLNIKLNRFIVSICFLAFTDSRYSDVKAVLQFVEYPGQPSRVRFSQSCWLV